jgi:hypothetical protein
VNAINPATARIVKCSAGIHYAVAAKPFSDVAYNGMRVKPAAGGFVAAAKARFQLVRIAASTVVREAV